MALMVQEKSAIFSGFKEDDGALLMSLLEESHCEEYYFDDERLNIVIRSLEAEINVNTVENHEFPSQVISRDCGGDLECSFGNFDWNEMEMVLSSQSTDDDMNLNVEHGIELDMDEIMEFMDESCYSQNYYAVNYPLPPEENDYSSLWHEANLTAM